MYRRVCYRSLELLLVFLCWIIPAAAQQPLLQPVQTGLPENTRIQNIYAAPDGYVYFSSGNSIFRFNGLRSDKLPFVQTPGANVTSLFFYQNSLWAGAEDGSVYLMKAGKMFRFKPEEGLPGEKITAFAADAAGQLWLGTNGEGIYCWTGKRLYHFGTEDGLPDLVTHTLLRWNNDIWAGTDGGLVRLSLSQQNKKVWVFNTQAGLPDNIVTRLIPGKERLIIGFQDSGIGFFDGKTYTPLSWSLPLGGVKSLALIQQELWWVTHRQELFAYDFLHQKGRHIPLQLSGKKLRIQDMVPDQAGNLWWNSNQGILRHSTALLCLPVEEQGIQAILSDRRQRLWYSTLTGLYVRELPGATTKIGLSQGPVNIISLFEDSAGYLWAGSFGQGIWKIHPDNLTATHYDAGNGLDNGNVFSIAMQGDSLFLGTLGGVYKSALGQQKHHFLHDNSSEGPGKGYIFQLKFDQQQRLWVATDGKGLFVRDKTGYHNQKTAGIKARVYTSLAEDKAGSMWFSSPQEGLYVYDGRKTKHFSNISGEIAALGSLRDQLYIIHPNGIDRLDTRSRQYYHWGKAQGLPPLEPYTNALFQDKNEIWLGGQKELIRIRAEAPFSPASLKLVFKDIRVSANPFDSSRHVLASDENQITFAYDGLWYEDPEAVRYRFKLAGYGNAWVVTRNQEITFPRLSPGKYTFMVEASTHEHFEDAARLTWSFEIKPPFYERWWFLLLLSVLLFAAIYVYIRTRDRRLKKQARVEQEKIQAQFETLKSQVSPHFLFNSFNTLLSLIETDPKKAAVYVEKLSDLFRNILRYRELDLISLKEELSLIKAYAYLQEQRFGKNFRLEIVLSEASQQSLIPPLTLQLLLENAIKHNIITHQKPLLVSIKTEGDWLVVTNNLQAKPNPELSTGFGLRSISDRYKLLSERQIRIEPGDTHYKISLPLLYAV